MVSVELIFVRWVPSFLQFWVSVVGLQQFAMERQILADSRNRHPKCLCPKEAASAGWPCATVFAQSSKVFSAVLGMEGTMITCLILSSFRFYRYTLVLTIVTLAGVYGWYLFSFLKDPGHLGLFTAVAKHKTIRKLSSTVSRNDLTALVVLISGLVASLLAEFFSAP